MKLNWNINYQIVSKYIYPINAQLVFEIPIANDTVYMKQDLLDNSRKFIVLLDTNKFIQSWRTSKNDCRFPNYHIGNEQVWRSDRKFHYAEQGFELGFSNPVPIISEIACHYEHPNTQISFANHFTRTIWLLANHAEYLPIAVKSLEMAQIFQQYMGRDDCAIHSIVDIYQRWWQTNQHQFPQAPDDWHEAQSQLNPEMFPDISYFYQ